MPSLPFLKVETCPDFWKKGPDCIHLWVNFLIQNVMFIEVPWFRPPPLHLAPTLRLQPWNIPGCAPALRHYSFCKTIHLKCLTVFSRTLQITTQYFVQCPYDMYCIRHIQNPGIFSTLLFHVYAGVFNHLQRY